MSRGVVTSPKRVVGVPVAKQAFLEQVRREEAGLVRELFKPGMRVLELGGGNGFQAQILASWGCEVTSIDLPESVPVTARHFPVQVYDGQHIPFPDHCFDVVFSSNTLEHIPHLSVILSEIARIVKADGVVVHILPTASWRFWTSLSHYGHILKRAFGLLLPVQTDASAPVWPTLAKRRDWKALLKRALFDGPHGAYPNALYELYAFSHMRWLRVFREHGFQMIRCSNSGLFYTGYTLCPCLSLATRRVLAHCLGSSTRIYVMRVGKTGLGG